MLSDRTSTVLVVFVAAFVPGEGCLNAGCLASVNVLRQRNISKQTIWGTHAQCDAEFVFWRV